MYSIRSKAIDHFDGALRLYSKEELRVRHTQHVRSAGKSGVRLKVFRTEDPVTRDSLSLIAQAFFVWNYDVSKYFGPGQPVDSQ